MADAWIDSLLCKAKDSESGIDYSQTWNSVSWGVVGAMNDCICSNGMLAKSIGI